jgi:hypothetical protein
MLEVELGYAAAVEVGIEDSERVELGNVVSSDLVSTDEELDLEIPSSRQRRAENSKTRNQILAPDPYITSLAI